MLSLSLFRGDSSILYSIYCRGCDLAKVTSKGSGKTQVPSSFRITSSSIFKLGNKVKKAMYIYMYSIDIFLFTKIIRYIYAYIYKYMITKI